MLLNRKRIITIFLGATIACIGFRLFVDIFVPFRYENNSIVFDNPTFYKDYGKNTPGDDPEIVETAIYWLRGQGYLTSRSFNRPSFRKNSLIKTAFRPKFSVYIHIAGIYLYSQCYTEFDLFQSTVMPPQYYTYYGILLLIIKWIAFIPSVFCFFRIAFRLTSELLAYSMTLVYVIYPSMIYVGFLNVFEPITTYLMVIYLHKLCFDYWLDKKNGIWSILFYSILLLFCMYLKPHVLLTILFLIIPALFYSIIQRKLINNFKMIFVTLIIIVIGHLPIIKSNYKDFNAFFLANQSGIDFFHGHNPYARGCWTPLLFSLHGHQLEPILKQNKDLPLYNEKQESDYYQSLGLKWMMDHPKEEFLLIIKKLAIFFLPHNFMSLKVNMMTLFIHVLFLCYLFFFFIEKRYLFLVDWYILGIIFAVLCLNIIYFVEYRWRFFCDPELLLLATVALNSLVNTYRFKNSLSEK